MGLSEGRLATVSNVEKLIAEGADLVLLTGNPQVGVTNKAIIKSIIEIKKKL